MKKMLGALAIAAMSYLPVSANADAIVKAGVSTKQGNVSGNDISVNNASIGFEKSIYWGFGVGLELLKGNQNKYWEMGFGTYLNYRRPVFDDKTKLVGSLGAEFLLASPVYNEATLQRDLDGNLIGQKWVTLDAGQPFLGVSAYPSASVSLQRTVKKHFVFEGGVRGHFMPYFVTENRFSPTGEVLDRNNKHTRSLVPEFMFRIGYKF